MADHPKRPDYGPDFAQYDGPRDKPTGGFNRPLQVSSELALVVGPGPLSRPETTKRLWAYIHAHGLQDSTNRRMINADQNLRIIFGGKDQVSMFEMTAMVSRHLTEPDKA